VAQAALGWLATGVLSVLSAGVVGGLHLEAQAAEPVDPVAAVVHVERVVEAAFDSPVVPAWQVAPLPVSAPAPAPAPVEAAPAAAAAPAAPEPAAAPPAAADPTCSGEGWQERRGRAALARLRRPGDAQAFGVEFAGARPDVIGLATVHERRLEVFVRPCGALSENLLRHVVAHELGHLVDGVRMTDALRAEWLAARGIPAGTPWYGCNSCTDFATPAGDFAEVYAQWQRGASGNRSRLAGAPSAGELEQLAARFWG
jgi:hypothetical protein